VLLDRSSMPEELIGSSPVIQKVKSSIARVAPTDSTVLIAGETGTGKELVARAIHKQSGRARESFVGLNCAALPASLIATELFGHEKGAFTGAVERRLGRFELADSGTLFLDEVSELSTEMQVALLRVLQERAFERVGGIDQIWVDVRVLAATNRDLLEDVAAGTFRSDLYYRLNVVPIALPPLRERKEDIPLLLQHFIDRYAPMFGRKIVKVDNATIELFQRYHWPGNIRELQNLVERSLIFTEGDTFAVDASWLSIHRSPKCQGPLSKRINSYERELIEGALRDSRGTVAGTKGAASRLGIPSTTLESRIKTLKINKNHFRS
jgi:formate hydrogenlyase transcriptional activator